jgi:hypothetical protein
MFQFIAGLAVGVWLGTKYDCRPLIKAAAAIVLAHTPKRRSD